MEEDEIQKSMINTVKELMSIKSDIIQLDKEDFLKWKTLNCYDNRAVLCVSW